MRLLILLGLCPGLWVGLYYHVKGCKRKARESWLWLLYAWLLWIGLAVLLSLVGR